MASKIKADQFETLDGSGNITLNNSVTMASGKTLPAASLTGALPAISGASLTGVTSVGGATGVDFNDDVKIRSGTGNDLEIYHNGTNSIIKNSTGITKIQADDIRIQSADDSESLAKFVKDGGVELYYNDSKKLETTSAGGTLTGTWTGVGGLSEADHWRMNAGFTSPNDGVSYITQNWERPDTGGGGGHLGTGMSEAAGVWTFPSTGQYLIDFNIQASSNADARYIRARINTTTNNSSYSIATEGLGNINPESSYWYTVIRASFLFDVTNVSTHKVKFSAGAIVNDVSINGSSTGNETYVTFLKLGET